MKKKIIALLAAAMAFSAVSAMAYYVPPAGPLYIQFSNAEQISPTGQIVAPSGAQESNWGIFKVSVIEKGDASTDPQNFQPSNILWASSATEEITGIFWGASPSPNTSALNATGGHIALYWDNTPDANLASATVAQRTADNQFTNFTDGTLLAQLDFLNGAIISGDPNTSITGTATPQNAGQSFIGLASSYANVNFTNIGVWSDILNSDYFNTALGLRTADVAFRNVYQNDFATGKHPWDATALDGSPIFGAQSSDPARANVVPEPSTIILLGAGLLGLAGYARRRNCR